MYSKRISLIVIRIDFRSNAVDDGWLFRRLKTAHDNLAQDLLQHSSSPISQTLVG